MKKKINFALEGKRADIGEYTINRILPNRYSSAIGPFVFLDHLLPSRHAATEPIKVADGSGAHPHKGIATLTYIINGEADHFDSNGNHAKVGSGGAQWMKAGNGVIHDEAVNPDPVRNDLVTHAMQFWINLPSKNKSEPPAYIPLQASEIPAKNLSDGSGWIKVIAGQYEQYSSVIPNYSTQFLYHIHLESDKDFSLSTEKGLEYALFLPLHDATINAQEFRKGQIIEFDRNEGEIEISNKSETEIDIIVFGGEKYIEPIVAQGPFVMNSDEEIAEAYMDFHAGKFGNINYGK